MKDFTIITNTLKVNCRFAKIWSNADSGDRSVEVEVVDDARKYFSRFFVRKCCDASEVETTFNRLTAILCAEYPQFADVDFMECAKVGGYFK